MSHAVMIRSVDDLALHMGNVLMGEATWDDVDLENLSVVVDVAMKSHTERQGQWDGRIDWRNAAFVQELQKHVRLCYRQSADATLPPSVLIKAESREGSNLFSVDFSPFLVEVIKTVPPELLVPLLAKALYCGTGVYAFGKLLIFIKNLKETQNREKELALIEKATEAVRDVAMEAIRAGEDPSKPIRKYVKTMRKGDTMSVESAPFVAKKEALEGLPVLAKTDVLYYTHADGLFDLLALDLSQQLPVLTLEQGSTKAKAYFFSRLSDEVRAELIHTVQESLEQESVLSMHLQVDVYFKHQRIDYCVIVGVGDGRTDKTHYILKHIPLEVPTHDWFVPGIDGA